MSSNESVGLKVLTPLAKVPCKESVWIVGPYGVADPDPAWELMETVTESSASTELKYRDKEESK